MHDKGDIMSNTELIELGLEQARKELSDTELFKMNHINFEVSDIRQIKDIQFDVNCLVERAYNRISTASSWLSAIKEAIEDGI